ncbi:copper chaperone PCu(A)C [Dyella sp. C11]|uniref:copper chaperone PCu(A)C n=1 Tax=Dyella sp. C11 TaxID=2126991 RepID=UPI001E461B15|nr:copper chaperone PCu(A)C [Dyella sp. C11]
MNFRLVRALPLFLAGMASLTAHATEAAHVQARDAWIRVLPGDLPAGGYVVLENISDQPINVRAVQSARYGSAMLHESSNAGGVSRMSMVDSLAIPAHAKVALSPGGYHLMLMSPTAPVKVGDKIKVSFTFDDGSTLDADFTAQPANAAGAGG